MNRSRALRLLATTLLSSTALVAAGCGGQIVGPGQSTARTEEGLSGCHGQASSSIPASGDYYLTSFGFSASDNGEMSCGSYTRGGTWYYAASRQRYGCGAHIQIEANGKCVIAQTDDYGPDACVEAAAGRPIIDASPLVSEHLFGTRSAGYSDHYAIHVTEVDRSTPLGPCDGTAAPDPTPPPSTPSTPSGCHSATLDADVASGTCVQSSSDGSWYHCNDGSWYAGQLGCDTSYPWCHSATLGKDVPPRTCVQSASDSTWYQCTADGWQTPVSNGAGPLGACASEYSL